MIRKLFILLLPCIVQGFTSSSIPKTAYVARKSAGTQGLVSAKRGPFRAFHRPEARLCRTRSVQQNVIPGAALFRTIKHSLFPLYGTVPLWQSFALNAVLFIVLRFKLMSVLTPSGIYHALALGTGLWATLGWRGWTLCVTYLFLGQAVTKVRFAEKEKMGIAEGRGGRRGPENVWGSAATGLACAIGAVHFQGFMGISKELFLLGYVASLATKLSDTFASEIGKAYGKTTFLITTFEMVEPGTEGAVSAEGTAASIVGGLMLALCGLKIGLISGTASVVIATVSAFIATNVESVLGATLQGKESLEWITNEVVNFINTLVGAALAIAGGMMFL